MAEQEDCARVHDRRSLAIDFVASAAVCCQEEVLCWGIQSAPEWFSQHGCAGCARHKWSALVFFVHGGAGTDLSQFQRNRFVCNQWNISRNTDILYFLGKYLLALAKGKTSEAISKLMDLAPATTTLLTLDDQGIVVQEREISSQLIQRRDIIKVHIKMKFPLDHPLLELSFNSMGLLIMNCSPMILHWLVCIQYQIFYPIVVHDWR